MGESLYNFQSSEFCFFVCVLYRKLITRRRIPDGIPARMQQVETKFLEWNVNTLAEQFALIEFSMFKAIDLKELCKQAWKGPNPRRSAPNVINLITRFEMVHVPVLRHS